MPETHSILRILQVVHESGHMERLDLRELANQAQARRLHAQALLTWLVTPYG